MLKTHARKRHLSFHTPGHKIGKWDITELSFSDNLSSPRGCIAEAERDIASILGAKKSFILTDGSTSGVLAMLYAVKRAGAKTVAASENTHKSFFNGCAALGLSPLLFAQNYTENNLPLPLTAGDVEDETGVARGAWQAADVLFLTSPDYYGNVAELAAIAALCRREGKLLIVDGAHGGHLHFDKTDYVGGYADLWVDGVHKSLPALTQGAVVSARTEELAEYLRAGVDIFRTTSPSYPVMASVEYAVKYPRNLPLERAVETFKRANADRIYQNRDWTKLCAFFGAEAFEVEKRLESRGIYAEFCDGNVLTFYLSPATTKKQWKTLTKMLTALFEKYPLRAVENVRERIPAPLVFKKDGETEWVEIGAAAGRICAADCGLFPPCTPLMRAGERITEEKLGLLAKADNVYGLKENKIFVYKDE